MSWTLALLVLAAPGPVAEPQPPPAPRGTEILIRPAPEPRPALKFRLFPEHFRLLPGNAALFYHRAIQSVAETRSNLDQASAEQPGTPAVGIDTQISEWISGPIDRIPLPEARRAIEAFARAFREVELGASRRDCDWGLFDRDEGIDLWLPEIQSMRSLARLVQLRIMLDIREGRFEQALHWIEVEFVMGRHAGIGPTLIQGMIGVAIGNVAAACLELFIQAPGSSNLCWALVNRPHPCVDLMPAMEWEAQILEREFPDLVGIEGGPWDLARARHFAASFDEKLYSQFGGAETVKRTGLMPLGLPGMGGRLTLATIAARREGESRRALLAAGYRDDQLAAMPVSQIVVLDAYRRYVEIRDDQFKSQALPAWQAGVPDSQGSPRTLEQKRADPILAMFVYLSPAVDSARLSAVRLERRLDALQVIEAIRMHAYAHGGQLPETLEAVTEAPVPDDPSTGEPFEYRRDGDVATLSSPIPPGLGDYPAFALRYLLKADRRAD